METLEALLAGFSVALTLKNLMWRFGATWPEVGIPETDSDAAKMLLPMPVSGRIAGLGQESGNRETRIGNQELLGELNRDRSLRLRCGKITSWKVFCPAVS